MVKLGKWPAEKVDCCPICGVEGKFVLTAPTPIDDITLDVYSCPGCNTCYNNPRMTKETMEKYYSDAEYIDYVVATQRNGRGSFGERRRSLRLLLVLATFTGWKEPTRCLDVGCSQGHFLERMKDWFYEVETVGYDLYDDPEAIREVVHDKSEITGTFDFISCIHTLEHVYDPLAELEWMNSLLDDGGTLFLELPTVRHIMIQHPVTFSTESVPVIMEHIGIADYSSLSVPALESCIVIAKKGEKNGS